MTVSYLLIGLLCLFIMAVTMNFFLESLFIKYVKSNQLEKNKVISEQISMQVQGETWNIPAIELIGISALEDGIFIKLTNAKGEVIWDATLYNSGLCEAMVSHMSERMMDRNPNWQGGMMQLDYPVIHNQQQFGQLKISFYGPYYYTESDEAFIETINIALLIAGVFAALLAVIVGTIMAGRISRPIANVVRSANRISEGHYDVRSDQKSHTVELNQLVESINQLAETLESQERLRRRMSSDIAHELRTPLTTLQSHLEAMIDGIWAPDVNRLESCHDEILRLTTLVGGLENLAKIEREIQHLNRVSFNMKHLVSQHLLQFQAEFLKKAIHLSSNLHVTAEDVPYLGDKNQISQIIVNLLSNALKYTESGGSVMVTLLVERDHLGLTIEDSGCGIAQEDVPFIFERFYRVDPSRNRASGGTGIGLTISKAIAEAHGGTILVTSDLGRGSRFTLILPL